MEKVIAGLVEFQQSPYETRKSLFSELANGQSPEVLFITCADSRIAPNLITQTEPGDLFVCRNAGNIVPPHSKATSGETASIEYAVAVLGVKDIVICGHSDCGAMKGALNPDAVVDLPHVHEWIDHSRAAVEVVRAEHGQATLEELGSVIEQNVVLQLQHLRTHPAVAARIAAGDIGLHGWVYNIGSGEVMAYDDASGTFIPATERYENLIAADSAAA